MEHIVKLSERVSMGITKENRVKLQNDSQESKCVSLSDDELKCLLTYALEIDEHVLQLQKKQRTEGRTWDLRREGKGNKRVTVKFFPEAPNIIIDIRVFNFYVEIPLPTKYGICLTRSEWQQFGEHHAQRAHTAVMKKIVREHLTEKVTEMAKQHCYGCEIDHPSQKQHMGETGCLADWTSHRDLYMEKCFKEMSLSEVLHQFRRSTDASEYQATLSFRSLKADEDFKRDLMSLKY